MVVEPTASQKKRLQIGQEKGRTSSIYFLGTFHIYSISHNYAIPQLMPHAISCRLLPSPLGKKEMF